MPQLAISIDDARVRRAFAVAPQKTARRIGQLVEGGAIDVQRRMRQEAPVHDGQYRSSIRYTFNPARLSAEVQPHVGYAEWVEVGSRPHWVSVRDGSPLRKWAEDHGINPFAVQRSIAKKGTKEQRVVEKTYNFTHRQVERDIMAGVTRLAQELDSGAL